MIYPQISFVNGSQTGDIDNTTIFSANVYINILDGNGNPANGNGMQVTYQVTNTGPGGSTSYTHTVNIIGQNLKIAKSMITITDNNTGEVLQSNVYSIVSYTSQPDEPPVDPLVCDATITTVNIDKSESSFGANDGQVTILATSSRLPLSYSLDGTHFQSSPTFTGLSGGAYTAYVADDAGCTNTWAFNMSTTQNLLITDPTADLGNGNISRWSAAFNPVCFTYQRKDFEVTSITNVSSKPQVSINADLTGVKPKDMVYINAGAYNGTYSVTGVGTGTLLLDTAYQSASSNTGFININRLRPYYKIQTEISYIDPITQRSNTILSTNRPNSSGLVRADISSFLQSLLRAHDDSTFSTANYQDRALSASYTIRYAEVWNGGHPPAYVSISNPYYVVYAAKQLGDAYGGNLAAYVPFKNGPLARWVTDFAEPAYSPGYPFDIGFIYGDDLAGLDIYCELIPLDINRQVIGSLQTIYLLNEDSSFLLNQDAGKLIIAGQTQTDTPVIEHIGLNRLLINPSLPANTYYFTLTLKYNEGDTVHTISQSQTIRVDDAVDERSVYLRWIGLSGCWNYYRFVYNQEVSLDVQNATIVKRYVDDWANQDGIEEVISKSAGQKMKVMAEDLSIADIKGLQAIKYSPKVQMLVNKNPVKWQTVVLNTATFTEYETLNGQAPFSVTFNLPSINIQSQ